MNSDERYSLCEKKTNGKRMPLYRETPKLFSQLITIFMTAYAADELIQQGMAEGVKTVLTKPDGLIFNSRFTPL